MVVLFLTLVVWLYCRLVGVCADLRVPPLARGDFEVISGQLQEESRRSLDGKKTLSMLEVRGQHADTHAAEGILGVEL